MSLAMLRRIFVGKESGVGSARYGAGGTPDRELRLDASVTPNRNLVEVANRHQASRAGVIERVVGSKSSSIAVASQPLQIELLPWLLSMCLAGGDGTTDVKDVEFVDRVTDANANAGTVANPTNPNTVRKYTFAPLVDTDPAVDSYALFVIGDGTTPQQIKFVNMDSMTIGIEPSGAATMAATLRGHYPADYTTTINPSPEPVKDVEYALGNAWTLMIGSEEIRLSVNNATLTIPAGITEGSYIDGGLEANTLNPTRRTASLRVTVVANAAGRDMISKLRSLTPETIRLSYRGTKLRETPTLYREIDFTLDGQFTDEGVFLDEVEGQSMFDLTFETLAGATGHDIQAVVQCAADDQSNELVRN